MSPVAEVRLCLAARTETSGLSLVRSVVPKEGPEADSGVPEVLAAEEPREAAVLRPEA